MLLNPSIDIEMDCHKFISLSNGIENASTIKKMAAAAGYIVFFPSFLFHSHLLYYVI